MPRKSEKIQIENTKLDKRIKLTEEDRKEIREEYATGETSYRKLAKKYGVSHRLIYFVVNDEAYERSKQQFYERQKDGRYYDKEKHRQYMKEYRNRKEELYKQGLIGKDGKESGSIQGN